MSFYSDKCSVSEEQVGTGFEKDLSAFRFIADSEGGAIVLPEWICLKCKYRWTYDGPLEPRYCPACGSPTIYVPKVVKPKYVYTAASK